MFKAIKKEILIVLITLSVLSIFTGTTHAATINPNTMIVSNLHTISFAPRYINWTWTDPTNLNAIKIMVYIDGKFKTNVSRGVRYYNATGFLPSTSHKISTRTVDKRGKINKAWVNNTAKTSVESGTGNGTVNTTASLGVFYYPWTGGNPQVSPTNTWRHWSDGGHNPPRTWDSHYLPDLGPNRSFDPYTRLYSSKNIDTINRQLDSINKAGIGFVISSWWGQGSYEDQALGTIFNNVLPNRKNVNFTIYYEKDGQGTDISQAEIINDINYIKSKYTNSPYFLKINGKPVIFVYNIGGKAVETDLQKAQKWKAVRDATGIYTVLKVFNGYQNYIGLADSWHQYAPAHVGGFEQQGTYSAFITPGFYKWNEPVPRLDRDNFTRWENNVIQLKNANVQFKLIETWNEWGEGSGIEPAQKINHDDINGFTPAAVSYGTKYVDILSKYFSS